jgi:hypothetical protein
VTDTASSPYRFQLTRALRRARRLEGLRAARAAMAILVAWHVIALALVAGAVYAVVNPLVTGGSLTALGGLMILLALFALLSIRPRWRPFVEPGPRLIRGEQPELFGALDEATSVVAVPPYNHVYVDSSAEGRVLQRGGVLGFGATPAIAIGVALLQTMSVEHLKVLAGHEGVRYFSSDYKFAALVERTRARLRAVLDDLAGRNGGLTSLPFRLLAGLFLKATAQLSRELQIAADDVVSGAIGRRPTAELLKMRPGMPAVLDAYGKLYKGADGPRFEEYVVTDEASRTLAFARFRQSEAAAANGSEVPVEERLVRLQPSPNDSRHFDERPAGLLVRKFDVLAARQMADRFAHRLVRA